MARVKKIDIGIYKTWITVFVGSHKEFAKWLRKDKKDMVRKALADYVESTAGEHGGFGDFYSCDACRPSFVRVDTLKMNAEDISAMAHEMAHATFYIMRDVEIGVNSESEEAFAYLQGYLLEEALKKDGWKEGK